MQTKPPSTPERILRWIGANAPTYTTRLRQWYKAKPRRGLIVIISLLLITCCCCFTIYALIYSASPTGQAAATARYAITQTADLFTPTSTITPTPSKTTRPTNTSKPTNTSRPTNTTRPSHTPTETSTTQSRSAAIPLSTATDQPTAGPAVLTTGKIVITKINYNGSGDKEPDEYVEIRNDDKAPIQLRGWTLSDAKNHTYYFTEYIIQPGQTCRIYTDEDHPESCGFNYNESGSAIWNNNGDTATLQDPTGAIIATYSY